LKHDQIKSGLLKTNGVFDEKCGCFMLLSLACDLLYFVENLFVSKMCYWGMWEVKLVVWQL